LLLLLLLLLFCRTAASFCQKDAVCDGALGECPANTKQQQQQQHQQQQQQGLVLLVSTTVDYRRLARSQVQASDGVLELGCSYGVCSRILQEHGAWLVAVDNSDEVITEVRVATVCADISARAVDECRCLRFAALVHLYAHAECFTKQWLPTLPQRGMCDYEEDRY
jgi:hypothetical protein